MNDSESARLKHLIVVGSSAGGIEALGVLVHSLPPDFPAPLVLAQHLDPSRPSHLAGILERRTTLPVVTVTDSTPMVPGTIYVVPSNRHVVIQDGSVGLEQDQGNRPRPSVDLLMTTAAAAHGEGLIAVVLTGSGSDGAAGAIEVKEHGGTVIIQNPRTAAHPSMPSALPPTVVDHVCELEQIGGLLSDLIRGDAIRAEIDTADRGALEDVMQLVTRHSSIDFSRYKSTSIVRRIGRRMAVNHTVTMEEYRDLLATTPGEVAALVKSLLIQVTDFFRDTEAFEFLQRKVMPPLIEAGRERGRVLRFWSAGCATGEESYSLAILLAHMLGPEFPEWSVKIFATDVDEEAIAYARRGFYPPNVLRNLPQEFRQRYFEHSEHGFRVSKLLRQVIIFGQQDLGRGIPFPRIDLVTCRNLLIYFKPELQQIVLDLFAYSLHQTRGYLFLGKAESARPSEASFELVHKKWKVYQCVTRAMPHPVLPTGVEKSSVLVERAETHPPPIRLHGGETRAEEAELRRSYEYLLRYLPIGICLIDRSYRILSINAAARRLLSVRETTRDVDFLHAVRGLPYVDVRDAIDRLFRERTMATLPRIEMGSTATEGRFVTLQIIPLEGRTQDAVMIAVENVSELVQTVRRLDAVQAEQHQLVEDLGTTNQRLGESNKGLQDANEELQAANEEMMLAQEELQATNEEFEATNEELQATNEELETNNEELQATNEELETTNEELQARTSELQEMTRILTGERRRLSEIVEQAPFHIMLLRGPNLVVESLNPPLNALFQDGKGLNRPFEEAAAMPGLEPVRAGVRAAYTSGEPWHSEWIMLGTPPQDRWFQFSVVPTRSGEGQTDGVVVYVEDVTERRRHEEESRLGKLKLMLEHANQLAMALFEGRSGRMIHASQRYLETAARLRHIEPDRATGMTWRSLWFGDPGSENVFEQVVKTGSPVRLDEVHVRTESPSVWDCSLIPIHSDAGGVEYVVLTLVEITKPVLAREELEQVDRLKDGFLSLASHELRTPLTPLAAYVELLTHLIRKTPRDEAWETQVVNVIDKFRRQIGYMSRLTEDLVDIARLRSGRLSLDLRPVDLRRIAEEGRDQALAPNTSSIRIDLGGERSLTVQADEMRLIQVVYNLLTNAQKHGGGDRVEVTVCSRQENGTRWGRVEVRDYGPGIPEERRGDLFRRFLQHDSTSGRAARQGLGLGLFIAARIVEQHGGRIGMDHHDPGTTMWFEVPTLE